MSAQSIIVPLPSNHARFMTLRVPEGQKSTTQAAIRALINTRDRLITQHPEAQIKTGVAFGLALWQRLHPIAPKQLHDLQERQGFFTMPSVPADVFIHVASAQADLCFAMIQAFMDVAADKLNVMDETTAFRYLNGRDLSGFIDGTENAQTPEDRAEVALLDDSAGVFADGSFVFAQRYVHNLRDWNQQSVDAQEKIFGRTKLESIELDDEIKPDNAHISRVVIEDEDGEELEILRHSLPYGNGSGEQGLYFVSYSRDLDRVDAMLDNMFGTHSDGIHDQFLHFTRPVDGAYFFMPSQDLLEQIVEQD